MAKIAKIQAPDGRVARFEVPDDYTPEQATAAANAHFASVTPSFDDVQTGAEFAQQPAPKPKATGITGRAADMLGGHEALAAYATGAVAKPAGDVAGLAQTAFLNAKSLFGTPDLNADPGRTQRAVTQALTYSPRTQAGQDIVASPYNPLNIIGRGISTLGKYAKDVVGGGNDDSSVRGMLGNAVQEAIPQAIGIFGYKAAQPIAQAAGTAASKLGSVAARYGRGVLPVEQRASRILAEVVGPAKAPAVIRELEAARPAVPGEKLHSGLAATGAASPEFAGLQKVISNEAPGKYGVGGIEGVNEGARMARIARHAGDDTLIPALEANRTAVTAPLRETAITNADLAKNVLNNLLPRHAAQSTAARNALQDQGRFQTMAAQQEGLARGVPVDLRGGRNAQPSNEPYFNVGATGGRAPPRVTPDAGALPTNVPFRMQGQLSQTPGGRLTDNFAQSLEAATAAKEMGSIVAARKAQANLTKYQIDSLAQHGHFPLTPKPVFDALDSVIQGKATPTLVQKTLNTIKEDIARRANADGTINASALYTVRKEIGNTIKTHAKETGNWDARLASGIERSVQKAIDDAIAQAGAGTKWGEYLREFASRSKTIGNVKAAQELQASLRDPLGAAETGGQFAAKAVELKGTMSPGLETSTGKILASLKRKAEYDRLVKDGHSAALERLRLEMPSVPSQGMFHPGISVARSLANRALGGLDRGTMRYLVENMDNPTKIASLLRNATPAQQQAVLQFTTAGGAVKYGAPAVSAYRETENQQ